MKKRSFFNTYNIVLIGIMTAVSLILSEFPRFPIIPAAPYLDVDFADVPIIFTAFYVHPVAGVIISLIKNLVGLFTTSTGGIGELSNFILSSTYAVTGSIFFFKDRKHYHAIIFSIVAIIVTTIMAMCTNYFLMLPLYLKISGPALRKYVITIILPFNLIKFSLQTAAFLTLYFSSYSVMKKFFLTDKEKPQPKTFEEQTDILFENKNIVDHQDDIEKNSNTDIETTDISNEIKISKS